MAMLDMAENYEFTPTEIEELLSLFLPKDGDGPFSPGSVSHGSNRTSSPSSTNDDEKERKLRRVISNRESARRSRWRKKKHLEDLTNELNRLMTQNRDLKDRLSRVLNLRHVVLRENDWLWMESVGLGSRLSNLCRIMAATR